MTLTRGWRPMTADDLDDVVAIAAIGFPGHPEDRACFASRLAVFPEGCFILDGEGGVKGYLITYPWAADSAPVLNRRIAAVPEDASVLYLHDLALHPDVRGGGWSRSAMDKVLALARSGGRPTIALVAVNDAVGFWQGHGFAVRQTPAMAAKLASYGADARYMVRTV
ncbi:GNAT family N-acetyltransferase [Brevundimonas variabilis]|uniref:Ribosomal protein S18 acetylase RimI-like enzyme n=1 Tax=Brevundimonas variabilis TaxID=74312 RepID=A0A7W9CGU6_9CAUL|nr:GNAT family N-acetyltransferase [Brevundimonas variabilis]MBB5744932.1 ribosomal protein S18 acetylase RimI-like enzyme [Brevundimonas variabilis]